MDSVALLTRFGLTNQEAQIYCALCGRGTDRLRVGKSNGNFPLQHLHGAGRPCGKGRGLPFGRHRDALSPVPAEEFCGSKIEALQHGREELCELCRSALKDAGGYLTVTGEDEYSRQNAHHDRRSPEADLRSPCPPRSWRLRQLGSRVTRGLKVVLITEKPFRLDGAVVYHCEKNSGRSA